MGVSWGSAGVRGGFAAHGGAGEAEVAVWGAVDVGVLDEDKVEDGVLVGAGGWGLGVVVVDEGEGETAGGGR